MPGIDVIPAERIPDALLSIIENAPLPDLNDNPRSNDLATEIKNQLHNSPFKGTLIESALWLLAGELDRSHRISQQFDSPEGSFWHAIMHRREGDYSNSKYWFRRVGNHPVLEELRAKIADDRRATLADEELIHHLLQSDWFSGAIVDACQEACTQRPQWRAPLRQIAWWEWQLLFAYTMH
ncbi:MAG: hypothetical protein KatS3mg111_1410 [Pirellulaceae bacterium]|nr:MAG: hypothetical protein KatS3mg111_1410 [Pirellulaceae bacterium]